MSLVASPRESEFVDRGQPKTTSNGRGAGGGRYVSGIDESRLKSKRNPVVSSAAALSWDFKICTDLIDYELE